MTQAELAYQHFTHRLAVETDAADVAEALRKRSGGEEEDPAADRHQPRAALMGARDRSHRRR